jgi:antiphage defense system Thoeris ThsB-like protein
VAENQADSAEFKYKAFISYSHVDRDTADWLHKALERYRIPKELHGTAGRDGPIPKALFPVFRDRAELASSPDLSAAIRDALQASAYLIVICSPAAAKSRWVNQEIIEFIKLGRRERIHALIVDGDPAAPPGDGGCFPPALNGKLGPDGEVVPDPSREVLATDLRPEADGKDDARLKLIAGLLGMPFNALRRREAAAARRRLLMTQGIAATMALLLVAIGVSVWIALGLRKESDDRQVPGVRVAFHETTLDLNGWRATTPTQVAALQKISSAVAHDRYTIVRTQPQPPNYVHTAGTSSGIPIEIVCKPRCVIEPRGFDAASRTPHEFLVQFDISQVPLETETTLEDDTTYWNAFQTPDQWWAGLRVSHPTDLAKFTIVFPALKAPKQTSIQLYYHDNRDHALEDLKDVTFVKNPDGGVTSLTWMISHPSTDRSYRVRWDWDAAAGGQAGN